MILKAMVNNTAFLGSASSNPFHFHHYDMINLVLYVDGVQHSHDSLTMNCSSTFEATRAYKTMFSSTCIHYDDHAHTIILEMFAKIFSILGLDLTPDREVDEEHICLPRQGNMRIQTQFKKALQEPVTCIFMLNFRNTSKSTALETLR